MPYSCKSLLKTDNGLASREKRLSICLGANGFSFAEVTPAGQLLTFGEAEGRHAATMTEVMNDLKALFAAAGIRPWGNTTAELIVLSDTNVWVPDELYTATANRKYLKLVGGDADAIMTCQSKALASTALFAADEQIVTAFKVAIPGVQVINQHVKMASLAPRSASHPVLLSHWREGRVDLAAFRDGRYLYGNTFSFADADEALYHVVDVMKTYALESNATELLMCGDVDRDRYAQFRPYFPQVTLFEGNLQPLAPEFRRLHTYRYALVLM